MKAIQPLDGSIKGLLIAAAALLLSLPAPAGRAMEGWLSGWSFRRMLTVDNPGAQLADHPLGLIFDNADSTRPHFEFSHAAAQGGDIRLTDSSGVNQLPFWIEQWSDTLQKASLWVRVPLIPEGGHTTLFLYYGNAAAHSGGGGNGVFSFYDSFEESLTYRNAAQPLATPTYDGSDQATHPDVVYFPQGWGSPSAYRYWMMMTPYPNGDENYENPSLLVSDDGFQWQPPPGVTNPLRPGASGGYNCDPDMIFADGQLRAYYCWAAGPGGDDSSRVIIFSSDDGVNWSDTAHVLTAPNYLVSPTLLYEDSTYLMWYVRSPSCWSGTSTVHRRVSADGLDWSPEDTVDLSLAGWVTWHLDVGRTDTGYVMLVAAYPEWSSCERTSLFRAHSSDGLAWSMDPTAMLEPSPSGWDSDLIYRSSFLVAGDLYRIWYSARQAEPEGGEIWHVGYTEGTLDQFLHQGLNRWDRVIGDANSSSEYSHSGSQSLSIGTQEHTEVYKYVSGQIGFNSWFYDALDTTSSGNSWITVYDSRDIIGLGVYVDICRTHYSCAYYRTGCWQGFATAIPRSLGWHKLTIEVRPDSSELWVDDRLAGYLDVLDPADIRWVELEGHGWFDDAYVSEPAVPKPEIWVGEEQWPDAVSHLRGERLTDEAICLTWSPLSGATAYWVYRSLNDPATLPDTLFDVASDTTWMDSTVVIGDPQATYYYMIRGWNGSTISEGSHRVGIFSRRLRNIPKGRHGGSSPSIGE